MPEKTAPRASGLLVTACDHPRCGCGTIVLQLTDGEGRALAEYRLQLLESTALGHALLQEVGNQLSRRRPAPSKEVH